MLSTFIVMIIFLPVIVLTVSGLPSCCFSLCLIFVSDHLTISLPSWLLSPRYSKCLLFELYLSLNPESTLKISAFLCPLESPLRISIAKTIIPQYWEIYLELLVTIPVIFFLIYCSKGRNFDEYHQWRYFHRTIYFLFNWGYHLEVSTDIVNFSIHYLSISIHTLNPQFMSFVFDPVITVNRLLIWWNFTNVWNNFNIILFDIAILISEHGLP